MKKKIIVALLALVLVFTFTSKADAQTFTDIAKHWAKPYIEYTSNLGYFTGYQDGTFKPNKKITRAEFVTILAKLKGFDNEDYILSMQDVKQGDWYAIYLNDLVSLGLVKNGIYFDASSLITRDEAFGLLGQLFPYKKPQEILTFADTSSVKRTRDITVLKEMGIVNGDNNNMLNPQGPLTRAEVASLIYNMMTKNIFINKADLASAKENNLFSFDFNAVGLINTYKEETVKKDTQAKKKTEHKVVDKYFVKSYEEALEKLRAALRNREEKFVFTYNPYTYKGEYTIASTLLYDVASYPEYFGAIENGDSEVGNKVTIKFKYAISKDELEMFTLLTSVSTIGPKIAMGILSSISVNEIKTAILNNDIDKLTVAKGIGKKSASRIILELVDKIKKMEFLPVENIKVGNKENDEIDVAREALLNLGYEKNDVEKVLFDLKDTDLSLEGIVKESLKRLI